MRRLTVATTIAAGVIGLALSGCDGGLGSATGDNCVPNPEDWRNAAQEIVNDRGGPEPTFAIMDAWESLISANLGLEDGEEKAREAMQIALENWGLNRESIPAAAIHIVDAHQRELCSA
jgi:hypothetical protein